MYRTVAIFAGIIGIVGALLWVLDRKSKNLAFSDAIGADDLDRFLEVRSTRRRLHTADADRTALYLAVFNNAPRVFEHLLSNRATVPAVYTRESPDPVLCACVMQGREKMLQQLLDAGYAPDAPNADGNTPLHVMAKFGSYEKAKILLDAGASASLTNAAGQSPHDLAVEHKRKQIQELLRNGAADHH